MPVSRRLLQISVLALVALLVLDDNARTTTSGFIQDGYAFVAGTETAPLPLERPPFLGLADLDDCLRGSAQIEGEDAYAAFCADLASFANEEDETRAAESPAPSASPAARTIMALPASASNESECLVDARGVPARKVDGIWVRAPVEGTPSDHAPSRLVAVPPSCAVQSPATAEVLYAGFFKGYLGVVIVETAKGKRVTIAGLGRVEVNRGDSIQRGGRIGETSAHLAPALRGAASGKGDAALLYVADGGLTKPSS